MRTWIFLLNVGIVGTKLNHGNNIKKEGVSRVNENKFLRNQFH